jgi:hypothetical protein
MLWCAKLAKVPGLVPGATSGNKPPLQAGSSLKLPARQFFNGRPYCRAVRLSDNLTVLLQITGKTLSTLSYVIDNQF